MSSDQEMRQRAQEEAEAVVKRYMAQRNDTGSRGSGAETVYAVGCVLPWVLFCLLVAAKAGMWLGVLK